MCGFGGVINHNASLSKQAVEAIASPVSFRGPDSCGIRILNQELADAEQGSTAIFFNRLAIIDLDPRSDQPFGNERYLLSFNGEIYNYRELKAELEKTGCRFHTSSDTEVLFQALLTWGTAALKKLNGMFAFFWLDKKERKFLVARDRLGIKPFYYHQSGNNFIFGSEIHSVTRFFDHQPAVLPEAVDMYLWMQFVPTPYSIVRGVYKLPPGHYIEKHLDDRQPAAPTSFWDAYEAVKRPQTGGKNMEEILKDSLERQLHADVPLGLFLSSGVDSSLLAALVNKYFSSGNAVNFFTVQFEQTTLSDESRDAEKFIGAFNNPNLHCSTIGINAAYIQDHLENIYDYYDEPFGDHAAVLNWVISKKAREHVTVAISGDGADELFWGYNRYNRWEQFRRMNRQPLLSSLTDALRKLSPGTGFANNLSFVFEKDAVKRHFNLFLPSGMRFKLNRPITNYPLWALQGIDEVCNRRDLPAILDIKTYLADGMLYKVDRSSMASSLEVRVPYLDNEVIDHALATTLPEKSTPRFRNKAPLKELLSELAPHYDLNRPKKGFNFPLNAWLRHNWKDLVLDTITKTGLEDAGLDAGPYLKIVHDYYHSRNNYFTDVWYIFNLLLWLKKFKRS